MSSDGPSRPSKDEVDDTLLASPETDPTAAAPGPDEDDTGQPTRRFGADQRLRPERPTEPGGRYTLGDQLGKGGMGEVLRAKDLQIGRDVAIKRMHASVTSTDAEVRFLREARIQGQLDHPAIVPVHEMSRDAEGRPFFVMKRLAGDPLDAILKKLAAGDRDAVATFPRIRLLRALAEVCLAVEFAHRKGVVHRDLKPANVMLGDYGEVYVLDWGIARMIGEADTGGGPDSIDGASTVAGTMLGTPGYMSPEQIHDAGVGPAADVYALGCILFEILAGSALHPRGEAGLASALGGVDARPSRRAPDREIAPELDALCLRATADDVDRRPTARELGDDLQRFLDGDRDVALRRDLARSHLGKAREALAGGTGEVARASAMREAGRALALDPTSGDAVDLVSRLMLEPPEETPREVVDQLEQADRTSMRAQGRVATFAILGYFAFIPVIAWIGVRDWHYLWVFAAAIAVTAAAAWTITRRGQSDRSVYYVLALNAVLAAVLARMFTPFLVAPGVATSTLTVFAAHPRGAKATVAWGVLASAVLGPWVLELVGAWPRTMYAIDGDLVLHSPAIHVRSPHAEIALALGFLVLLGVAGFIARVVAKGRRESQRALLVHAWHLHQLVPAAAPPAEPVTT